MNIYINLHEINLKTGSTNWRIKESTRSEYPKSGLLDIFSETSIEFVIIFTFLFLSSAIAAENLSLMIQHTFSVLLDRVFHSSN